MAFWVARADAPVTDAQGVACGYGTKLYVLSSAGAFWCYDPDTDTWSTSLAQPPHARTNTPAMAAVGSYIYVWGGLVTGGDATELWRYDPAADTWYTGLAHMPNQQTLGGGAALGNFLYYVCGFDQTSTETGRLYEYDIAGNSWSTKTACTSTRNTCGVAADSVNGKLYMAGGKIGSTGQTTSFAWTQGSNTWAAGPSLGNSKDWPGSGAGLGASIYFIGGFDTFTLAYIPYAWLLGTGNQASMPGSREWPAVGVLNGKIYAVGGFDGSVNVKTTYELNFAITATGKSTTSGAAAGTRDVNAADYIGQQQIGRTYQVGGTSAVADTNTMARHPRGRALRLGTDKIGTVPYELGGGPAVDVAGTQAPAETDTGRAGSILINNTSGQASETDSAFTGTKAVTKIGAQASTANTGLAGRALVVSVGAQATEHDTTISNVSAFARAFIAAYRGSVLNGPDSVSSSIGIVTSNDGVAWTKQGRIGTIGASSWESGNVTDPCLVVDDHGKLFLYYAGKDMTGQDLYYKIGVATSTDSGVTWTESGFNPIITKGASGAWDDQNVRYPFVIFDHLEADPAKKFKMWYCGRKNINPAVGYSIGYAFSADGLTWTKDIGNPRLSPGAVGSYDHFNCLSPVVLRVDAATWIMWYGAQRNDYSPVNVAETELAKATFTSPQNTYTKDPANPLMTVPSPYNTYNSNLHEVTATLNIGDTALHVANSGDFSVDDDFYIVTDGTLDSAVHRFTLARVTDVPSTTQVNFAPAMTEQYVKSGTNFGAFLRKLWMGELMPRSIVMLANVPTLYCSLQGCFYFSASDPGSSQQDYRPLGRTVALTALSLDVALNKDYDSGVMIALGDAATVYGHDSGTADFDHDEADQISVVVVAGALIVTGGGGGGGGGGGVVAPKNQDIVRALPIVS